MCIYIYILSFSKAKSTALHNNAFPNHPPTIIKQVPKMIIDQQENFRFIP